MFHRPPPGPAIFLAALLLIPTGTLAEIYKCVRNGQTIFAQQPCGADAVEVEPKVLPPSSPGVDAFTANMRFAREAERERRLRESERALWEVQEALSAQEQQRAAAAAWAGSSCNGLTGLAHLACLERAQLRLKAEDMTSRQSIKVLEQQRAAILHERERLLARPAP